MGNTVEEKELFQLPAFFLNYFLPKKFQYLKGKSLEDIFYPNLGVMVDSIAKLITGRDSHGISLPDEKSMADVYKHFKGPF